MPEVRHLEVITGRVSVKPITGWASVKPNTTGVKIEIDNIDGSFSAFLTREQVAALRDVLEDILK